MLDTPPSLLGGKTAGGFVVGYRGCAFAPASAATSCTELTTGIVVHVVGHLREEPYRGICGHCLLPHIYIPEKRTQTASQPAHCLTRPLAPGPSRMDLDALSWDALCDQKEDLQKRLARFQQAFDLKHGRNPAGEELTPAKPAIKRYRAVCKEISLCEQVSQ